jgi:hypothetical protein
MYTHDQWCKSNSSKWATSLRHSLERFARRKSVDDVGMHNSGNSGSTVDDVGIHILESLGSIMDDVDMQKTLGSGFGKGKLKEQDTVHDVNAWRDVAKRPRCTYGTCVCMCVFLCGSVGGCSSTCEV